MISMKLESLMLIFQDTILSVVASIQLNSNNMVKVGDWITIPGDNVDGDIIEIALHTIKVQNWDKTIVMLPTRSLINKPFTNWRGMFESGGRRIKRSIYIDQQSIRFLEQEEINALKEFGINTNKEIPSTLLLEDTEETLLIVDKTDELEGVLAND